MRTFLTWVALVLISTFGWAEETANQETPKNQEKSGEAEERVGYLDPEYKKQQALAATLKAHEITWLDISYPDYPDTQKVLAIAHPSLIPEKQGAILLIHDKEQHADWPQIIRPLRQSLPESGWYTFSVNLPDETRIRMPERSLEAKKYDQLELTQSLKQNLDSGIRKTSKAEQNEQSEAASGSEVPENNDEASSAQGEGEGESVDIDLAAAQNKPELNRIPYKTRALAHIEKAMEHLKSQNYQNIILMTHRHSAELALSYIEAHQSEISSPGFALVMIEPILPELHLQDLTKWLGESFKAPILEIIDRSSLKKSQLAESMRLALVRAGAKNHRQIFLSVSNTEVFEKTLARRIQQWLDSNAPGMKIGN